MINRFTEDAQEALQRAQQIMYSHQHNMLDVEHIFLALLQQRNSVPTQLIARLGVDVAAMTSRTESALSSIQGFNSTRGTTTSYITLRANRVLQEAAEEADRLLDEYISTEHLLLAIAVERGGATARILQEAGIDYDKVIGAIGQIRGDGGKSPEISGMAYSWRERGVAREIINPPNLAKPVGFNHGILTTGGRLLFLGGQAALDAEGKVVAPGDVVAQYRQALANLKAVVEEAGGTMQDVVKMNIFVSDRDDYKAHLKELGQVHKEFFGAYYPATALLEVSRFFEDGILVEVEGIAVLG